MPVPSVASERAQLRPPGSRGWRLLPPARLIEARRRAVLLERPLLGPHRLQQLQRRHHQQEPLPHRRLRRPPSLQRVRGRPSRHAPGGELARGGRDGLLRRERGGRVQPPRGRVEQAGEPERQVLHRGVRQGRERGVPARAAGGGAGKGQGADGGGVQERVPGVRAGLLLLPGRVRHGGGVQGERLLAALQGRLPGLL